MNTHTERPICLADGKTYCACGRPWPCPHADPTAPATCLVCGHAIDGRSPHPPECAQCPEGYCETSPTAPSVILAGIWERHLYIDGPAYVEDIRASADDVPLLLAAVEAALKQADEWTEGSYSSSSALDEDRAWVRAACGAKVRAAITAALTGKEGSEDE